MRIYEKYFASQVYLTFIFVLFAFSGLFFFFDLINELNSVGHGNYKFQYAVLRVALQTPSRFYEIIPVAALISAIYVFAQMAANSEYTIFRVSGLATNQALRSLLNRSARAKARTCCAISSPESLRDQSARSFHGGSQGAVARRCRGRKRDGRSAR